MNQNNVNTAAYGFNISNFNDSQLSLSINDSTLANLSTQGIAVLSNGATTTADIDLLNNFINGVGGPGIFFQTNTSGVINCPTFSNNTISNVFPMNSSLISLRNFDNGAITATLIANTMNTSSNNAAGLFATSNSTSATGFCLTATDNVESGGAMNGYDIENNNPGVTVFTVNPSPAGTFPTMFDSANTFIDNGIFSPNGNPPNFQTGPCP